MGLHFGNRPTKNTRFSLQIGSFFKGGYYVGNITVSSVTYGIILAPISSVSTARQWKTTDTPTPGTQSLDDGWTNTNNMNDANHPAAQYARSLTTNGYNDWYLPSLNEHDLVIKTAFYSNLLPPSEDLTANSSIQELWTSTENNLSTDKAYVYEYQNIGFKNIYYESISKTSTTYFGNSILVRAVRRFII
jgi:hypothetical protein